MKLAPTGLGAEPKKLALLAAVLVGGGLVYWNLNRSDAPPAVSANVSANVSPAPPPAAMAAKPLPKNDDSKPDPALAAIQRRGPVGVGNGNSGGDNWIPTMKPKDDMDVTKIDPRIRLDLLAKVRAVPLEGGASSLFEFSKPPEPPAPKVDPIKPVAVPVPPPAVKPATATSATKATTPPPPPPIPFKFYGYDGKAADGQLRGYFVEGDPITGNLYLKREGDVIKDRYKIVRIGIKSAIVEDTVSHNQQTLQLLEEQQ